MVAQIPSRKSRRLLVLLGAALGLAAAAAPARAELLVFGFSGDALPRVKDGGAVSAAALGGRRQEEAIENEQTTLTALTTVEVLAAVLIVPPGTMPTTSGTASNLSSVTKAPGGSGTSGTSGTGGTGGSGGGGGSGGASGGLGHPASLSGSLTESAPEPTSICLALSGVGFGIVVLVLRRRRLRRLSQRRLKTVGALRRPARLAGVAGCGGRRPGSDRTFRLRSDALRRARRHWR
jgi:hypothetical protein